MGLHSDKRNLTATVSVETYERVAALAKQHGVSISTLLAGWMETAGEPVDVRRQSVRAVKDELMVSLPRDWIRRSGAVKGDRIQISYSDDALIIRK